MSRFASSRLSWLPAWCLASYAACGLAATAHGQSRPAGGGVPVALSTRVPDVSWGTTERRPEIVAASSRGGSAATPSAEADPNAKVQVSGLKGTLNKDDVHQTMAARERALHTCIERARHDQSWLSGQLRFSFRVDGNGRVAQLRPLVSSVGHYELEQCLTQVVLETQFPRPAGRAAAEFTWGMSVDPGSAESIAQLKPSAVKPSVRKHKQEIRKQCDWPRRARAQVTAYVSTGGHVLSSGAIATPAAAQDAVPCVLSQLEKWQLPKQRRISKVSFELR